MNKDTELTQEEFEKLDRVLMGYVRSMDRLIIIKLIEELGFRISESDPRKAKG